MTETAEKMFDTSPVFSIQREVKPEHIDLMEHANNTVFVRWMEECAVAHSASFGWDTDAYVKLGAGWVVTRHEVVYTRPALLGALTCVETWVPQIRKATSRRCYRWVHVTSGEELGRAATDWAFVDIKRGRPVRIPPEVRLKFPIHAGAFDSV